MMAPHSNEYMIVNGTAMNDGQMSDAHIVADDGLRFFEGAMDDCIVLDINAVADADGINIAADNGVEPNRAVVAHNHIPYQGGIGGDETVLSHHRKNTMYGKNAGHAF